MGTTHEELIEQSTFPRKFKRPFLNYYNYGFKSRAQVGASKTTDDDWQRLQHIAGAYLQWSQTENAVRFASMNSQSVPENPFHRAYRFCKHKPLDDPGYFFATMAVLSRRVQLRDEVGIGFDAGDTAYGSLTEQEQQQFVREEDYYYRLDTALEKNTGLSTSDLRLLYGKSLAHQTGKDQNKTANDHLQALADLGFLVCRRNGGKGNKKWSLAPLTMQDLLTQGENAHKDFATHLADALAFYAGSFTPGTVAALLQSRLGSGRDVPFRFQHAYYMQALNDYHLLDLLHAIENGLWCRIKYTHGTAQFETELLVYPLEIRVHGGNGRMFLMYYEPLHRAYTSLRLEFIMDLQYYTAQQVVSALAETAAIQAPADSVLGEVQPTMVATQADIDGDLERSRRSMTYSWGVSTTPNQLWNAKQPAPLYRVELELAYDPATEAAFVAGVRAAVGGLGTVESVANGRLYVRLSVTDTVEMRPWVRSLYGHLVHCSGMDHGGFTIEQDMAALRTVATPVPPEKAGSFPPRAVWRLPQELAGALGKGENAVFHNQLFHENFSIYYYLMADVFVQLSAAENAVFSSRQKVRNVIEEKIEIALQKYQTQLGTETENALRREIFKLFSGDTFVQETVENGQKQYAWKFKCAHDVEFYRDVVPLSTLELRFLLTLLQDEKARLFFTEAERATLAHVIGGQSCRLQPFPVVHIHRVDRGCAPADVNSAVFSNLLQGIHSGTKMRLTLSGGQTMVYLPIWLLYSNRTGEFRLALQRDGAETHAFGLLPLSLIKQARPMEEHFDRAQVRRGFAQWKADTTVGVTVCFYDQKNMADRILTEFAPWEKVCRFVPADTVGSGIGQYRLTINYHQSQGKEVARRLLRYGGYFWFAEPDHSLCANVTDCMERQRQRSQRQRLYTEPERSR